MKKTNNKIKMLLPLIILLVVLVPIFVNAAPIIPCGGNILDEEGKIIGQQPPCDFNMLMKLVNNIINWIIIISVPVAAGVFAWAGLVLMTSGDNAGKRSDAKDMIQKVFIGFVAILAAWIIVNTITNTLLSPEFKDAVPVEGTGSSANNTNP